MIFFWACGWVDYGKNRVSLRVEMLIRTKAVNLVDFLILVPLVYGAFRGFHQGLLMEMSTFFGLLLGVFLSLKYAGVVEGWLREWTGMSGGYSYYVAFGVTFVVVIVAINVVGRLLTRLVDAVSLGMFNKLLGVVVGVLKGALVVCVVVLVVDWVDRRYEVVPGEAKEGSCFYVPVLDFSRSVYRYTIE